MNYENIKIIIKLVIKHENIKMIVKISNSL